MERTKLEKASIIFLLAYIIAFTITIVVGLFLVIAGAAGIISWSVMTFFVAIGGVITILCLMCWFVLMMIDIMRE